MIAAAQIIFDNTRRPVSLAEVLKHLQSSVSYACTPTEWRGFTTVIPQVLVETRPPLTVQIEDDPSYVPDEIEELAAAAAGVLDGDDLEKLKRCRCRLEVMSASPARVEVTGDTISVHAETDLNPDQDGVREVLLLLANLVDGYIYDCVSGRWVLPDNYDI